MLDHELTGGMCYPEAAATLDQTLSALRDSGDVDRDRVAVWFFSGGGPLAYPLLAADHDWLRCVGSTYPLLPTEDIPGWPSLSDALIGLADTPVVLTRVEHEIPQFVARAAGTSGRTTSGPERHRRAGGAARLRHRARHRARAHRGPPGAH